MDNEFIINERILDEAAARRKKQEALEKSVYGKNTKVQRKKKDSFKINLTAIILAGLVTVGAVKGINTIKVHQDNVEIEQVESVVEDDGLFDTISSYFSRNDKDSELNMDNLSKEIGSLVFEKTLDFNEKYDTTKVSIPGQCIFRTADNKGYYYNTDIMARKILKLEDRTLRKYAIAHAMKVMMEDGTINNEVQAKGMSNGDSLFYYLMIEENVKEEDKQFVVDTLKDYLRLEKCDSVKELIERADDTAEYVNEVVKQEQIDRGIEEGAKKNA